MKHFARFLLLVAVLALAAAPDAQAGSRPDRTFVTNGPVQPVVRSGDTIYIGGRFNQVGPRTGFGVEVASDGTLPMEQPEVSGGEGLVKAVAPDGSGGWYIGGLFTHVGAVARNNIAHILADKSVDPSFDPNANGSIQALEVSGSTVYAGGGFTSIGGQVRNRMAALNADDGTVTSFNLNPNGEVAAIVVSGSTIYAGGFFTPIGGLTRNKIAALNPDDGTATPWNPDATANVLALAVSGSTVYAGGNFTSIGGQPRQNIAAINAGDGTPTPFSANANDGVFALAVSDSTVYAGGFFTTISGQPRSTLAALTTEGIVTSFDPNGDIAVFALVVAPKGTLHAGGSFRGFDLGAQQGFASFSQPLR